MDLRQTRHGHQTSLSTYRGALRLTATLLSGFAFLFSLGQQKQPKEHHLEFKITKHYLNIPIGYKARMKLVEIRAGGELKREFPVQLADDTIGYWIYIDVSEFRGQTIDLHCAAGRNVLSRIYQDDRINGEDSLYHESNRPQFHFTVKRGWSNDVNGPIWYRGQYHLFWQSFPFGLSWNTGFMYWGHALSKDLLHWEELAPALMLDSLGSPWSGTAIIDANNDGGWGKDAMVLFYTAYDRVSFKQVQCIAYSTDGGKTFTRSKGNPIIDSNWEMETNDTRDPKVFWYEPGRHWVLVLFEGDGMSFYNSTDLRTWKKQSHFPGLAECPDLFELPVDGNPTQRKWVLHGGSSDYFIGSFDGKTFTPETGRLHYAEGQMESRGDLLYAVQSFANMPDHRRVQMAWGKIGHPGMPFTQMMLFPTEMSLRIEAEGIRLVANPIKEIDQLHDKDYSWQNLSAADANRELKKIKAPSVRIKFRFTLADGNNLRLRYQGNPILEVASKDLTAGEHEIELLIDKTVAEIFIDKGERYIIRDLDGKKNGSGLEFDSEKYGPFIVALQVYEMKSIW